MTKIISYIHFLGCIGWSIFILIGLIVEPPPPRGEYILLLLVIPAALAITGSGIYLFIYGQNRLLLTKIVSYINFLGCIGWSICGFCALITGGLRPEEYLVLLALFATTASGIHLFVIRFVIWRQALAQLWKIKKLTILWAGTFVIVDMCLFPPFVSNSGSEYYGRGYAYLFSDRISVVEPKSWPSSYTSYISVRAHIDFVRLIIQCAIVGLITGVLLYTLKDKKDEGAENEAVR